jgi:hypothetical protein
LTKYHGPGNIFKKTLRDSIHEEQSEINNEQIRGFSRRDYLKSANPIYKNYYQLTCNKMLKFASSMMAYFDKVGEMDHSTEASKILGAPTTTLDEGIKQKQAETVEMENMQ